MEADVPQVSALLTVTGVSVLTVVIMELVKRAAAMSDEMVKRWGPLLSVAIATTASLIALVVLFGEEVTPELVVQAVLTGIMGGAAASGIYGMTSKSGGAGA